MFVDGEWEDADILLKNRTGCVNSAENDAIKLDANWCKENLEDLDPKLLKKTIYMHSLGERIMKRLIDCLEYI